MFTFVIIGGGFSGAVTAVHLLRARLGARYRVIIVNRSGTMARGVAYGTQSSHHVLNVPAGRMSALEHDSDSFVRFVRARGLAADGGTFVSRHLYGAYLESLLNAAADDAGGTLFERIDAEALRIQRASDGSYARVSLSNGDAITADRVVLAVGNFPPGDFRIDNDRFFSTSRRYIRDPWARDALSAIDPNGMPLLIGTGLTMVDIVLELRALGLKGRCIAISRHGLLPLPHRRQSHEPERTEVPTWIQTGPATVRAYLRAVRRQVQEAVTRGADWRDVMASLRPITPGLWQALPLDERRRFLRHLRPLWEVHRHRLAPELNDAFLHLRTTNQVTVLAGRVLDLCERTDHVLARVRPRGCDGSIDLRVGSVINCTGPTGDTRRMRDALFDNLRAQGVLRPDALGLGIEMTSTGALIGADGRPSSTLYYVGPLAKARDWEATAVPELRRNACCLAEHLRQTLPHMDAAATTAAARANKTMCGRSAT